MSYRVVLQRLALEDLQEAADRAPQTATRWLERFQESLETLDHNPQRCPLARESNKVDVEVREFLVGRRPYEDSPRSASISHTSRNQ